MCKSPIALTCDGKPTRFETTSEDSLNSSLSLFPQQQQDEKFVFFFQANGARRKKKKRERERKPVHQISLTASVSLNCLRIRGIALLSGKRGGKKKETVVITKIVSKMPFQEGNGRNYQNHQIRT